MNANPHSCFIASLIDICAAGMGSLRKITHPRSTAYDGPSAVDPVVHLEMNRKVTNLFINEK